jgi:hypothetical protein
MKHLTAIALTLASICVATASDFEGVVNLTTTTKKGTTNFVYFVQGAHLRTEVPGENGAAAMIGLVDWTKHEMYMLMPQQKMYMTFNLAKALDQAQSKEIAVEETGRTETIAGYEAKEYIVRERKTVTEIWATPDLGRFMLVGDAARSKGKRSAWEHVIADRGLFPLRTIVKNAKGVETSRSEITSVERKTLEASLFEIPADYQKFGLGALGRMIGGG